VFINACGVIFVKKKKKKKKINR